MLARSNVNHLHAEMKLKRENSDKPLMKTDEYNHLGTFLVVKSVFDGALPVGCQVRVLCDR